MSIGDVKIGFDAKDPVIKGKTNVIRVTIPNLLEADVASAEFILADETPDGINTPSVLVTKTGGSGIVLTDDPSGLLVTITLDPADTQALTLTDFFFRLDYNSVSGGQFESVRGSIRLTPRV